MSDARRHPCECQGGCYHESLLAHEYCEQADSNPSKHPNGGCRPEANSTYCRYCGAHPDYQSVTDCPSRPADSYPSKRHDEEPTWECYCADQPRCCDIEGACCIGCVNERDYRAEDEDGWEDEGC